MTVRLTVQRALWEAHLRRVASGIDGLVPVVKGNGYGFGRAVLHPIAATLSNHVCVGTIHELDGVARGVTAVVLTPTLAPPSTTDPVVTIGSCDDVAALDGWNGRVIVKLRSSMRRYGASAAELGKVIAAAEADDLEIIGFALHLPLAGSDEDRLAEIDEWLERIDRARPLWVSHLDERSFAALRARRADRTFRLRVGTRLWHGDKSFLHLDADVLAVQPVAAGERAGYRLDRVSADGHIVMIGAGSANGVATLAGDTSPFHFARRRLALIEPPHMHTSMAFVPAGAPCPRVGDRVDVQRPLNSTSIDELRWV